MHPKSHLPEQSQQQPDIKSPYLQKNDILTPKYLITKFKLLKTKNMLRRKISF